MNIWENTCKSYYEHRGWDPLRLLIHVIHMFCVLKVTFCPFIFFSCFVIFFESASRGRSMQQAINNKWQLQPDEWNLIFISACSAWIQVQISSHLMYQYLGRDSIKQIEINVCYIIEITAKRIITMLNNIECILPFCRPACIAVYKFRDPNKLNYIFCLLGLLK